MKTPTLYSIAVLSIFSTACRSTSSDQTYQDAILELQSLKLKNLLFEITYASDINIKDYAKKQGACASSQLKCAMDESELRITDEKAYWRGAVGDSTNLLDSSSSGRSGPYIYVSELGFLETRNGGTSDRYLSREEIRKDLNSGKYVYCSVETRIMSKPIYYSKIMIIPSTRFLDVMN